MRNTLLYLNDIHFAILAIEGFVETMNLEIFEQDDKPSNAVIRKFEIIGEAAKNLSDEIPRDSLESHGQNARQAHSHIFGIQHELVWQTIKDSLPKLKSQLETVLSEQDVPNSR